MDAVMSAERYKAGADWHEFMASEIRNKAHLAENYRLTVIPDDRVAKLREIRERNNGPRYLAVIGEDWCPDVYRGLPVAQRVAEVMEIDCRVFRRDENKDLVEAFLFKGEFASIPVFIFMNSDYQELAHFIERPKLAHEQLHIVHELRGDVSPASLARKLGRDPSDEEVRAARAEARERYWEWQQGEMCAAWRIATVDECIDSLDKATSPVAAMPR